MAGIRRPLPASLTRIGTRLRNAASRLRAAVERAARRVDPPKLVLVGACVVWCSVFSRLVELQHTRFRSEAFDLGIYDQAVWLLARGHSFITVRGLDVFGQHASVAFFFLAPFSWLGAGPQFLNVLQVVSLGLGAVAVYHAARFHLENDWLSVALAAAFLLHPSVQWFAHELFHPEVVAIAPLLFAYVAALHRRWHWFFGLALFALLWKEDVALSVAALGVVLLARKEWRAGALTVIGSLVWFLLATQVLVPHQGSGVFYARQFYGDFGSSTTEVARTVLTEPTRVVDRLQDANAAGYVRDITQSYGFVSLLSPLPLLMGLPQTLFNLISVQSFTWRTDLHYAALPVTAATIAMVEGTARARRLGLRRFLVGLVVVAAWASTVTSGTAPVSRRYASGIWPLTGDTRQELREKAVRIPPGTAVVSATYGFVPHLTHRRGIYMFPNPWILTNYGQSNKTGPNPRVVQWLVVDYGSLGPQDLGLFDKLVGSGEFRVVESRDGIVVAARESYCLTRPSPCGAGR